MNETVHFPLGIHYLWPRRVNLFTPLFTVILPNTGLIVPNRLLYSRLPGLLSIFTRILSVYEIVFPLVFVSN